LKLEERTMARISGTDGNDTLPDTEGDDYIMPGRGDDAITLGPGRDSVEIEPYGGNDVIFGFTSGEDTLLVNYFPTIDSPDDVTPYIINREADASIDLTAAAGGKPGPPTMIFRETTGIFPGDLGVNTGEFYDPDYVPIPPPPEPVRPDPFDDFVLGTDGNDLVGSNNAIGVVVGDVAGREFEGTGDPSTDGDDTIYTKGGLDAIWTHNGDDIILITPDSGSVFIKDFDPSRDAVVFNDFPSFDSFDDLKSPFLEVGSFSNPNYPVSIYPGGGFGHDGVFVNVEFASYMSEDELTPNNIMFNRPVLDVVTPIDPGGKLPPRPSVTLTDDINPSAVPTDTEITGSYFDIAGVADFGDF
jgi:hypothetical protein